MGARDVNGTDAPFRGQVLLKAVEMGFLTGEGNTCPCIHTELDHLAAVGGLNREKIPAPAPWPATGATNNRRMTDGNQAEMHPLS